MGLDVYLYRYENKAAVDKTKALYEKSTEALWKKICGDGKYEEVPEAKKKEYAREKKKVVAKLGTDEWGTPPGEVKVELDSKKFPEHMFKIGYFRSSYNGGGIERVVGNMTGKALYWIFENPKEYEFQPNWARAMSRAEEALAALKEKIANEGAFRISFHSANPFAGGKDIQRSEEDALKAFYNVFNNEKKEKKPSPLEDEGRNWFGNSVGEFYLGKKGIEVVAIIPGMGYGNAQGVYVVTKDDGIQWYVEALEVVVETCQWVLDQKDQKKYWVHWSS